jgi:hypothetical protein
MNLISKISGFYRISSDEKILFIKGIILSGFFCLCVLVFPLRVYIKFLRENKTSARRNLPSGIKVVTKTIRRVARNVPWKCNCLNKVLVAKWLYDDLGISGKVYLSLFRDSRGEKIAHASLLVGENFHFLKAKGDPVLSL